MYMYINYVAWLKNILGISDAIITGLIYCIWFIYFRGTTSV